MISSNVHITNDPDTQNQDACDAGENGRNAETTTDLVFYSMFYILLLKEQHVVKMSINSRAKMPLESSPPHHKQHKEHTHTCVE